MAWRKEGHGGVVKDGVLTTDPKEFEVPGGLLGTDFKHSRFSPQSPNFDLPTSIRRLFLQDDEGFEPIEAFATADATHEQRLVRPGSQSIIKWWR